jgi:hypothetical protein
MYKSVPITEAGSGHAQNAVVTHGSLPPNLKN